MKQSECEIGMHVFSIHHPEKIYIVRENHNPKGAGLTSSMDIPSEHSFFVLYDNLLESRLITDKYLETLLKPGFENAGTMPCFKGKIITPRYSREFIIARWPSILKQAPEFQIWIDSYDLCRISYIHQLTSLLRGLNATLTK